MTTADAFMHATLMLVVFVTFLAGGFVLLCGDVNHTGLKGKISRGLQYELPALGYSFIVKLFGQRAAVMLGKTLDWVVNKPNPLLQGLYVCMPPSYVCMFVRVSLTISFSHSQSRSPPPFPATDTT